MTDKPAKKRSEEREKLKVARRLASSAEKREVIREWLDRREAMRQSRGGEIVLPDHTADVAEIQARLRARALVMCEDIMLHSLSERNQLRAIELVLQMGEQPATVSAPVQASVISDEQAAVVRDILVQRRQLQRQAGGQ